MMHDRVADQRHFQDFAARDVGLARGFADQRVHRLAHHARQLLVAARVHHHVGDAAHQVFAEADLRVHRPDRCDDLAAREIGEVGGDGGRADIDRDAEGALGEARHDGDDVAAFAQRDGDLPFPRAQRLLQTSERREIGVRFVEIPLLVQSLLKAAKIARRLVHVRLADLDVIEADDRIDLDRMRLRALADDLPMNLAFGRHVDDEIAANPGLAAKPAAGSETLRASRHSGPRPLPTASHDRRWNEWRAWRNRPRRCRPDSGRKCLVRRTPNRDRRRARARLRADLRLRRTRPACRRV